MPVITNKNVLCLTMTFTFFSLCNLLYEEFPDRIENRCMERRVCAKIGKHSDTEFAVSMKQPHCVVTQLLQ